MAKNKPELLLPAGSPKALEAAIEAGADAVYFGTSVFNARMGARNFGREEMDDCVRLAHAYGVKCYVTLNTCLTDRELHLGLAAASDCCDADVDALIVADMGLAASIHRAIPEMCLHASTQASGHCVNASRELEKLGFSRMVMAREASFTDIKTFTQNSDMELEVFVHGALCMSHSGQCLFSSLVGGRSGNRGECAQPCRLPYLEGKKEEYPLSLKDLCLARYVPDLIGAGVSSFKIEGRMKSPEYVLAVGRIWRRLIDENRAATDEEMVYLSEVFSRGGFTDRYFTSRINESMLGVRSETDKNASRQLPPFDGLKRRIEIDLCAVIKQDTPSSLTVSDGKRSVTTLGDTPQTAISSPMTVEDYERCLTKLGSTPYRARNVSIDAQEGLMMPVSRLNSLRREAIESFAELNCKKNTRFCDINCAGTVALARASFEHPNLKSATFADPSQITSDARQFFDRIYLPLFLYDGSTNGIIMPPVIFDRELSSVKKALKSAREKGAEHILVGNLGHLALAKEFGFTVHGDFRLNAMNCASVNTLTELGFEDVVLSPELTLPQIRDIAGNTSCIVYGRIPLMLLEKCVIKRLIGKCDDDLCSRCRANLKDRKGITFPVIREAGTHRNTVLNSLPTCMSDRGDELTRYNVTAQHFIFTVENAFEVDRVINAFYNGLPLPETVRRIMK